MATATVNGHSVSFYQANDPDLKQPAVATVSVTVTLAFDDLVAALYLWVHDQGNDMADPGYLRLLVTEAVVNAGLADLSAVKAEMAAARPGSDAAGWLAYCQHRAGELLATGGRRGLADHRRSVATLWEPADDNHPDSRRAGHVLGVGRVHR